MHKDGAVGCPWGSTASCLCACNSMQLRFHAAGISPLPASLCASLFAFGSLPLSFRACSSAHPSFHTSAIPYVPISLCPQFPASRLPHSCASMHPGFHRWMCFPWKASPGPSALSRVKITLPLPTSPRGPLWGLFPLDLAGRSHIPMDFRPHPASRITSTPSHSFPRDLSPAEPGMLSPDSHRDAVILQNSSPRPCHPPIPKPGILRNPPRFHSSSCHGFCCASINCLKTIPVAMSFNHSHSA